MNHHPIKSSMAASIAHNGDTMHVKFKGGKTYAYNGVTAEQFEGLKGAESFGKHLNSMQVKGTLFKPEKNGKS